MNNFDRVEREIIQEAVLTYDHRLRRNVRDLRDFLEKLKEIGLYSAQMDDIRTEIEDFESWRALCKGILHKI